MSQENTKFQLFGKFTGLHMALCIGAFFGVIIAVNLYMATLASSSWTGLVVKNTYVESQKFNSKLSAAQAQKLRGWHSVFHYNNDEFKIEFLDKDKQKINVTNAQLFVGRPAFEQQDQLVALKPISDGVYQANVALAFGEWDIRITGNVRDKIYRREERLFVDAKGIGKVEYRDNK